MLVERIYSFGKEGDSAIHHPSIYLDGLIYLNSSLIPLTTGKFIIMFSVHVNKQW